MNATILILYVEDDILVALPIVEILEEAGFLVEHVADGAAAIARLGREPAPAAIITDIRLPSVDGWEIAHCARERYPGIPVVYASGDSAVDWTSKGVPESVMLQKPCAEAQLLTAVATLLNQRPISM